MPFEKGSNKDKVVDTKKQLKQPKEVVAVNKSKKVKESKIEAFNRIATPRVLKVLKDLRILGNCSNRNNYDYNESQINKMYGTILETLDSMISKFSLSKKELESFSF